MVYQFAPKNHASRLTSSIWPIMIFFIILFSLALFSTKGIVPDAAAIMFCIVLLIKIVLVYFKRQFAILYLNIHNVGITLHYLNKDELIVAEIPWRDLDTKLSYTLARPSLPYLVVKRKGKKIASFYTDFNSGFKSQIVIELHQKLKIMRSEYIEV
jgi:hypothetical protein